MITEKKSLSVKKIAVVGILGAISAVLGMTPLGFIPVGPTSATTMHIPVIIGAIMEGPVVGALIGLIFGLFSMFRAITNPTPVSFVFLNPLVSVVPRVLIGIFSYYSYTLFKKLGEKASIVTLISIWALSLVYLVNNLIKSISLSLEVWNTILNGILIGLMIFVAYYSLKKMRGKAVEVMTSAAIGTLTNTVGVLSSIYLIYGEKYMTKLGMDPNTCGKFILGIGITNGIPEIIVAMIIVTSVIASLKKNE